MTRMQSRFETLLAEFPNVIEKEQQKFFQREEKEIFVSESHQSRREREFVLKNIENQEEKKNGFKFVFQKSYREGGTSGGKTSAALSLKW